MLQLQVVQLHLFSQSLARKGMPVCIISLTHKRIQILHLCALLNVPLILAIRCKGRRSCSYNYEAHVHARAGTHACKSFVHSGWGTLRARLGREESEGNRELAFCSSTLPLPFTHLCLLAHGTNPSVAVSENSYLFVRLVHMMEGVRKG